MTDLEIQFSPQRLVADLCWVVNSPSLLTAAESYAPLSVELIDSDELLSFISQQRPKRVGHYFELLVLFWLTRIRKVDLVAHNQPILDGKRTIGEIDFLFYDEAGDLTHLEVASKFYLYSPPACASQVRPDKPSSHFLGPNASDNFEKKVSRVFQHQLPLSKYRCPNVQKRIPLMKGRIFYNSNIARPETFPSTLSPDHLTGQYVHFGQLDSLPLDHSHSYQIMPKPLWFTAAANVDNAMQHRELKDFLTRHFSKHEHAIYLFRSTLSLDSPEPAGRTDGTYLFVVSDRWPN